MNILIVSTHTSTASGKEHVNALIDSTGAAVFYNYNPEKNL